MTKIWSKWRHFCLSVWICITTIGSLLVVHRFRFILFYFFWRCGSGFKSVIFKPILFYRLISGAFPAAPNWMPQDLINDHDRSTFVQVIAWCRHATSHYLSLYWPRLVPWWRHQMKTFSALYWPFVRRNHWSPVHSPHKGQWRKALMFSLICAWTNGWANNRDAGNLRRYRAHYDVHVLSMMPYGSVTRSQWVNRRTYVPKNISHYVNAHAWWDQAGYI